MSIFNIPKKPTNKIYKKITDYFRYVILECLSFIGRNGERKQERKLG